MPLRLTNRPAAALGAAKRLVLDGLSEQGFRALPRDLTLRRLRIAFWLPSFWLAEAPKSPVPWPGRCRDDGWMFLLLDQEQVIATVEVDTEERGYSLARLRQGGLIAEIVAAVVAAEAYGATCDLDLTLAWLSCPAVGLDALWLRTVDPQGDVLVPIRPHCLGAAPGQPIDAATFLTSVDALTIAKSRAEALP